MVIHQTLVNNNNSNTIIETHSVCSFSAAAGFAAVTTSLCLYEGGNLNIDLPSAAQWRPRRGFIVRELRMVQFWMRQTQHVARFDSIGMMQGALLCL